MPENLNPILESDPKFQPVAPTQCPGQIYRRILVTTDFTAASTPALKRALKLAKQNHAELLICLGHSWAAGVRAALLGKRCLPGCCSRAVPGPDCAFVLIR
jgi:fructose-specific component phosphotransferase system IIB-like protein